jgi:hypothetical protein
VDPFRHRPFLQIIVWRWLQFIHTHVAAYGQHFNADWFGKESPMVIGPPLPVGWVPPKTSPKDRMPEEKDYQERLQEFLLNPSYENRAVAFYDFLGWRSKIAEAGDDPEKIGQLRRMILLHTRSLGGIVQQASWPAAGSVDTRLSESRLHFELHGT